METQYFKEYSPALNRDMEIKVYEGFVPTVKASEGIENITLLEQYGQ